MQFTYKQYSHAEHWPYLALSVSKGTGAAPFCNCPFTRQDPAAYPSSEVRCLHDKCIKLASKSCLGKRTVSRNHAILARGFKGNKQFAKRATFRLKNTRSSLCKHWRLRPSLANHWFCYAEMLETAALVDPNMHGASERAAFRSKHLA